jgi:molecular chaperone GrpE
MKKNEANPKDVPPHEVEPQAEQSAEDPVKVEVLEDVEETDENAEPDFQTLYEETKGKLLRHYAEFENASVREATKAATVEEFLTVYDHFGMALEHADGNGSVLRQGMEMILAEFRRTFEALGVEEMDPAGKPFDPSLHEAIAQEPSDTVPEGHVLRQWKSGFRLGDKLLRAAAVVVSSGPADGTEKETNNEGAQS